MKKLENKKVIGIFVVIILLIIGIGGILYMDKQAFNNEMVAVVRSEEAKKVLEQGLKNLDPKALTPDGIIKSYEVDYDSIQHNTMGGIIFDVITNQDKKLMINTTLSKDSETNNLKISSSSLSTKLAELVDNTNTERK